MFLIGDNLFKTKLLQQLKLAWRKMLLMKLNYFLNVVVHQPLMLYAALFVKQ